MSTLQSKCNRESNTAAKELTFSEQSNVYELKVNRETYWEMLRTFDIQMLEVIKTNSRTDSIGSK